MSRRAFAAVSVLWGLPYLFIKVADDDDGMPPLPPRLVTRALTRRF
ncbi:MAG TPA: hypothetical protein VHV53_01125 [Solirubrobacterales bacterium]|jgi:hypothetical protein|nr:hypothetical protein [Solirubrobacterales bacterium]